MILKQQLGYEDTARKCKTKAAVSYMISSSLHEWKSFRHCADVGASVGLPKVKRSTLSKKVSHLDYQIMKALKFMAFINKKGGVI